MTESKTRYFSEFNLQAVPSVVTVLRNQAKSQTVSVAVPSSRNASQIPFDLPVNIQLVILEDTRSGKISDLIIIFYSPKRWEKLKKCLKMRTQLQHRKNYLFSVLWLVQEVYTDVVLRNVVSVFFSLDKFLTKICCLFRKPVSKIGKRYDDKTKRKQSIRTAARWFDENDECGNAFSDELQHGQMELDRKTS